MTCLQNDPQGAEILMDYCAGELEAAKGVELESHIRECAACWETVESQRKVWEALEEWKPVEVSSDFDSRLYVRIAEDSQRWWRRWLWEPMIPIAAASMLALVLLPRASETRAPAPSTHSSQVVVSGERIDLRQVEQALDDMDMLTPVGQTPSLRNSPQNGARGQFTF